MSANDPNKKSKLAAPAKVIAVSVVLILLGIGLCNRSFHLEGQSSITAQIGIIAFLGGIAALGVGFLWLLIAFFSS